jgi:hypothetical protein
MDFKADQELNEPHSSLQNRSLIVEGIITQKLDFVKENLLYKPIFLPPSCLLKSSQKDTETCDKNSH